MAETAEKNLKGCIFNIQKFTIHDGPGIRTEVFFKGCPLHCLWCSNPEGIHPHPEVGAFSQECLGIEKCGLCIKACKKGALQFVDGKIAGINRELCVNCAGCARVCPNHSLKVYGTYMTVQEVMKEILADRSYYKKNGGGVTLSGGDCLMQHEFVTELLKECKRYGIHTCVESQLTCRREVLDNILPYTDMVITDIKQMDPSLHRKYTGMGNGRALSNIGYLAMKNVPLVVRIPVVPGYNDQPENMKATAEFLAPFAGGALRQLQLLPYRPLGLEKYEALNRAYPMGDYEIPRPEEYLENVKKMAEEFRTYGIPASAGTTNKIE